MRTLERYMRPFAGYIALTMLLKALSAGLELAIPRLMERILDHAIPAGDSRQIALLGGMMALCAVGCFLIAAVANRMSAVSSGRITCRLRQDLFEKMFTLSNAQMDTLTIPSAQARMTSDTIRINEMLSRVQRMGVRAPILLVGGILMSLSVDKALAMILVAAAPVIGLVVWCVTRACIPMYAEEQNQLDRLFRVLRENLSGVRVVRALSRTEYETRRFGDANEALCTAGKRAGLINVISNPASTLILNLGLTTVVLFGAYRVDAGACQPGVIVTLLQYFTMILNAMLGITKIFVLCARGIASADRIEQVMQTAQTRSLEEPKTAGDASTALEFRDVSFSYSGRTEQLSHISFRLEKGQSLGIIGVTGSGKTTVLNLLQRFYAPQQGGIYLHGQPIEEIPERELRGMFGTVAQNDFIMRGTIAENIRFFRDIPEQNVKAAAQIAQAAEYISGKPKGFEEPLAARGENLSGGQRQRLLIARALAGNPEILLLDDAASALDYETEAALRCGLAHAFPGMTTIQIAQRISSIEHCTAILVLEGGKAVGYGTHGELLRTCPLYREICLAQGFKQEVQTCGAT